MLTFHPMMEGMQNFAAEVMPLLGRGGPHHNTGVRAFAARN